MCMNRSAFFLVIVLVAPTFSSQECRLVPVCNDNNISGTSATTLLKGDKGEQGIPGKAGPQASGLRGEKGSEGLKGEPGSIPDDAFYGLEQQLQRLEGLLTPDSCYSSNINGEQLLRSGEKVFCDDGWMVFQRRIDGSVNFDRPWLDYKVGFGNMSGEFWLGLEKVHALTKLRGCKLRINLWDFNYEQAFAEYGLFSVESEDDHYRLHVDMYTGNAGDALQNADEIHDGKQFTTRDADHDGHVSLNCARDFNHRQGGWWFDSCFRASLNAPWGESVAKWSRIMWHPWKGSNTALKATTMQFRCD